MDPPANIHVQLAAGMATSASAADLFCLHNLVTLSSAGVNIDDYW